MGGGLTTYTRDGMIDSGCVFIFSPARRKAGQSGNGVCITEHVGAYGVSAVSCCSPPLSASRLAERLGEAAPTPSKSSRRGPWSHDGESVRGAEAYGRQWPAGTGGQHEVVRPQC